MSWRTGTKTSHSESEPSICTLTQHFRRLTLVYLSVCLFVCARDRAGEKRWRQMGMAHGMPLLGAAHKLGHLDHKQSRANHHCSQRCGGCMQRS
eukprot:2009631-Rhodomonas_salina.2